jgi:acetyltransferase-like isoleucine patch superfamily enzyme
MKVRQYLAYERALVGRWVKNLVINCLPDFWIINRTVRPALARLCGAQCGAGVILQKGIFYGNPRNLRLGKKCAVSRGAFLDGYDKITMGDNVAVAFGVTFITGTHELGTNEQRAGRLFGNPIVVGDGVWIGALAIIGPGTEIGAGSMVSAGAAAMHSVPANSLVAGVPGKVVARLQAGGVEEAVPEGVAVPADVGKRPEASSAAPADAQQRDEVSATPEAAGLAAAQNNGMTKAEFYAELESLLELERGSIKGTEFLRGLTHWDSMAVLAFIALADAKLHEVTSPAKLAACRTVSDLVDLFPGKIS